MCETLSPEQLAGEAGLAYRRMDYPAAQELYQAAAAGYSACGDFLMAAEMKNDQSVSLLQAGQPEQALRALTGTLELFTEGGDLRRQALVLGNQAAALEKLGRLDEAMSAYEHSAEILKQIGESDLRAYAMQAISKLQFRQGRQLEALATMQAGIDGICRPSPRQRLLKRLMRIPMKYLQGN